MAMKIGCYCGASIIDQTDDLPHKGHLIPDQEWFDTYDAIDEDVIDSLARGLIDKDTAENRARSIIRRHARLMYQCRECGRLYIFDLQGNSQCYLPENDQTAREILRSRSGSGVFL
jgi:hypothetical protein